MKTQRTLRILFIVCFCAMLTLPLAFADFTGGRASETENRMLASFPTLQNGVGAFYHGVEPWLNDNIGFRDAAAHIVTQVDYSLFRRSAKSNDLIGKEDWIYYYSDDILADFIGSNAYTPEETDAIAGNMRRITERLAERGCEALFVLVPDKKTVYPEYYPAGIHRVAESTRMTRLSEALAAEGLNVLDLQPALEKGKELGWVYSQRLDDAHWNALGAYVGYQSIVERLQSAGARKLDGWSIMPYEVQGRFNATVPLNETNYIVQNGAESSVLDAASELASVPGLQYNQDAATYQRRTATPNKACPSCCLWATATCKAATPIIRRAFRKQRISIFQTQACSGACSSNFSRTSSCLNPPSECWAFGGMCWQAAQRSNENENDLGNRRGRIHRPLCSQSVAGRGRARNCRRCAHGGNRPARGGAAGERV